MIDIFAELNKKFNIIEKTKNLCSFAMIENNFDYKYEKLSFLNIFNEKFHFWHLNDNYPCLDDFLVDIGILEISKYPNSRIHRTFILDNEECCYKFLQFLKNAVEYMNTCPVPIGSNYTNVYQALLLKIQSIVNKLNLVFTYDKINKYYKLTQTNFVLTEISKQSSEDIAHRLFEYNYIDNKNNLSTKREILLYLATYTESITKTYTKNSGDIYELYSCLDFALNNLNVRHDNRNGKKQNNYSVNLTDNEQVKIYDKIFDLFLEVLSIHYTSKSLKDIKLIKDKFDKKQI